MFWITLIWLWNGATLSIRPVARIEFGGGGVRNLKKWTFWTQKEDFFLTSPPLPSYKNPIFGPLCG